MKKTNLLIPVFTLLIAPCISTTVWGHNTQNTAHNAEHPHSPCYDPDVPGTLRRQGGPVCEPRVYQGVLVRAQRSVDRRHRVFSWPAR